MFRKVTRVLLNAVRHPDYSYLLLTFTSIFCVGSSRNGLQILGANRMQLISAWLVALGRVESDAGWCVMAEAAVVKSRWRSLEDCPRLNRNNPGRCCWPEYRFSEAMAWRSRSNTLLTEQRYTLHSQPCGIIYFRITYFLWKPWR